jgi:4-amino-4-deoxy-L-arabinose transferase-like glycosyltransferase
MASASFYLRHAAAILFLVFAMWGWGAAALRSFVFESAAEGTAMRLGAGAAVLSMLVFVLGLAGLLARPWFLGAVVLGVVLGVASRPSLPRVSPAAFLVAAVLGAPIVLQLFYPPVDWDATSYHLASSKLYLEAHRLVVATYLRYPVFPQLQEMLFTLALGISDDIAAHGINFAMWLGTGGALLALGRRVGSPAAGVLALGLWAGSPTAFVFGSVAYVDVPLTFYVTLACLCAVIYAQENSGRWAGLAGLFAGAAAATKYSGLFFVAAIGLWVLAVSPREARVRRFASFAGLAALVCLPWYLRNAMLSGDPLFPFLGRVFPNRFWNATDLAVQIDNLHQQGGRTLVDFLRVWDRLAFNQGIFVGPEDTFSPALWIPLPILLLARWKSPAERGLLLLALAFLCVWFFGSPSGRYLLPVIPLLCLGTGATLWSLAAALRRRTGFGVPVALLAALLAIPGTRYAIARTAARGLPPVTPVAREAFIEKTYPTYPLYRWIEDAENAKPRIYAWRDSPLAYYAPGTFLGDWFGPARYSRIESVLPSASAVRETLAALGATYFVVPHALGPVAPSEDSLRAVGVVLVHAGEGGRVFLLGPARPVPSD